MISLSPTQERRLLAQVAGDARAAGMPAGQVERFLHSGYAPLPAMMDFHAAARRADRPGTADQIAIGGARGPGKSHATMAQLALDDCQRYEGLDVLFLRKVGKAARESLEKLRKKTFIHLPHTYNRQQGIIRFVETGSTLIAGHFQHEGDIDKYIGIEYDVIAIEEATQLSEHKKQMLRGSLRSSKPGWRPRMYYTTNPGGIGHQWFKQTFVIPWRLGREGRTRFFPSTYQDNPFLDQGYVDYLESLTGVLGRMWRDGDWDVGAGMYFVNWTHDVHVMEPFPVPAGWPVWASMDYGFSHPTAVLWHTTWDGNVYTVAEHVQNLWLPEQHAGRIKAITGLPPLNRQVGDLTHFVAGHDVFAQRGDEKGKTVAEQYEKRGIDLSRARIDRVAGAAEMLRRLGNPAAGVPPSWFVFDTCVRLIADIPAMQQDPHRPEDILKVDADPDGQNGDDVVEAARYGLMVHPTKRRQSVPRSMSEYR